MEFTKLEINKVPPNVAHPLLKEAFVIVMLFKVCKSMLPP
jgi:hypothetical protein